MTIERWKMFVMLIMFKFDFYPERSRSIFLSLQHVPRNFEINFLINKGTFSIISRQAIKFQFPSFFFPSFLSFFSSFLIFTNVLWNNWIIILYHYFSN